MSADSQVPNDSKHIRAKRRGWTILRWIGAVTLLCACCLVGYGLIAGKLLFWQEEQPIQLASLPGAPAPEIKLVKVLHLDDYSTGMAWSPDGKHIATSEKFARVIKIWDTATWRVEHKIVKRTIDPGFNKPIFTPDSKYLIVASTENGPTPSAISVIDVATGEVAYQVDSPDAEKIKVNGGWPLWTMPTNMALSPDGSRLYAYFGSMSPPGNLIYIFDTRTWATIGHWRPQWGVDTLLVNTRDGTVITSDVHGMVQVWDATHQVLLREFKATASTFRDMAIDVQGERIATAISGMQFASPNPTPGHLAIDVEADGFRIWNIGSGRLLASAKALPSRVAFSLSGKFIVAESPTLFDVNGANTKAAPRDGAIFRAKDLQFIGQIRNFADEFWSADFSSNGKYLALAGDNDVLIYSYREL